MAKSQPKPKSTSSDQDDSAATGRSASSAGAKTRARITAATIETLKAEGIVGTSARSIARAGDFNQALIFYHFGSINDAIVESVTELNHQRLERHREELDGAESLPDLIRIARRLHQDDAASDNMAVLAQAFAGASGDPDIGPRLYAALEPWTEMVNDAIVRVVGDLDSPSALPARTIASAIGAMFLGIELLDGLDPTQGRAVQIFDALESLASLLDDLLLGPMLDLLLTASAENKNKS